MSESETAAAESTTNKAQKEAAKAQKESDLQGVNDALANAKSTLIAGLPRAEAVLSAKRLKTYNGLVARIEAFQAKV
jgi:hypothetical protein